MRFPAGFCLLLILIFALPTTVFSQSLDELRNMTPEDRRLYLQSMSDEERSAMRDKWRAEYDILPEEEKRAIRIERREDRHGRWKSMSEEERAAVRKRFHKRKGNRLRRNRVSRRQ